MAFLGLSSGPALAPGPSAVGTGPGDLVITQLGTPVVFTRRGKLVLAAP